MVNLHSRGHRRPDFFSVTLLAVVVAATATLALHVRALHNVEPTPVAQAESLLGGTKVSAVNLGTELAPDMAVTPLEPEAK